MIVVDSIHQYGADEKGEEIKVTRIQQGSFQLKKDQQEERELANISVKVKAVVEPKIEQLDLLPKEVLNRLLNGKSGLDKLLSFSDVQGSLLATTKERVATSSLEELMEYATQLSSLQRKVAGNVSLSQFFDEMNKQTSDKIEKLQKEKEKVEAENKIKAEQEAKKAQEEQEKREVESQQQVYMANSSQSDQVSGDGAQKSYFAPPATKTASPDVAVPSTDYSDTSNTYLWGNCTWGVKAYFGARVGDYWGDAKDWAYSAMNAGFAVDGNPVAWNTVAVFTGGLHQTSVDYGHVAIVSDVKGDQVEIYEMNALGGLGAYNYRWVPKAGISFIHV